jgi:crotonobetainyl-CoA:carnitine CoA-transferase CaiB-like acyl-CoA transferase
VVERPDLLKDPRFAENKDRVANRAALAGELARTFATRPVEYWVDALLAAGIPAGPIYDYSQSLSSQHAMARGAVIEIAHPVEGRFRALGNPVKLSETPPQLRYPPPLLDEHREAILDELELGGESAELQQQGAFTP